jgi:hypothetical protein
MGMVEEDGGDWTEVCRAARKMESAAEFVASGWWKGNDGGVETLMELEELNGTQERRSVTILVTSAAFLLGVWKFMKKKDDWRWRLEGWSEAEMGNGEGRERRVDYPQRGHPTRANDKKEVEGELHWS